MQKVQSQIKTTKCQMNTSLSFSGKASQNFLNDAFILFKFGRKKDALKKSLLSPYFKAKNHRDSQTLSKQKTLKTIRFKGFYVHPAGLEPATC